MIRKQFKLLFAFDATTASNQEPPTCLPNGSKSNCPTKNNQKRLGCNEHTSWPTVAFGRPSPSPSSIDGSPKTDCSDRCNLPTIHYIYSLLRLLTHRRPDVVAGQVRLQMHGILIENKPSYPLAPVGLAINATC
ncbi:LOW QUALITY PROTEIN: uncharacterized protein LOC116654498 [Drosophila ananassae]|uniref:LOW QUALITY PROTEIN: uncharacterized protein LOC116654498 n=1 Tax=Drosophila ananassae TaxID=7217 RepID=UPI0013A5D6BB|nr:LOW QUALITY PROTEIN: uncharacterized protein LOC116654498 [Drosophila ananassae]